MQRLILRTFQSPGDIVMLTAPVRDLHRAYPRHFWIIVAGGKYDFTAKWWNPDCYQRVVDHIRGLIHFCFSDHV